MKIALITDTHFGARNDSKAFADYFGRFYSQVFFPYLKENNINNIIHLGDVVDRRKFINFYTARHLQETLIQPIIDNNYTMHCLIGNHDTYFKNTNEINSMKELYGNITYDKIYFHDNKTAVVDYDGCKIFMLPWICNSNYNEFVEDIKNTDAQVLMGHLELHGFEMMRGHVNDGGMDSNIFSSFDVVCSGHFHHKSTQGNVNYLGAPYEITWIDHDDPRGFHIFDTDDRSLTFVRNPLRMFHKVWYDDMNKTMDQVLIHNTSDYKDGFVKVIVTNKTNPYWFDLFIDRLEKADVLDIQVVEDHLNLNLESDDDIINEAEDTLSILTKYVNSLDVNANKSRLDSLIRNLYSEALAVE